MRQREQGIQSMLADIAANVFYGIDPPWPDVLFEADRLSSSHSESLGTRSSDILHVASALVLGSTEFLTFDRRQTAMAQAVGLFCPNIQVVFLKYPACSLGPIGGLGCSSITRYSVLDCGCPQPLFCLGTECAREQTLAYVDFTAVSKAPEGWSTPRPGGQPLDLNDSRLVALCRRCTTLRWWV